ncbi:MAG: hypothetical protein AB7I37_19520 [Pirellulales bacterium]
MPQFAVGTPFADVPQESSAIPQIRNRNFPTWAWLGLIPLVFCCGCPAMLAILPSTKDDQRAAKAAVEMQQASIDANVARDKKNRADADKAAERAEKKRIAAAESKRISDERTADRQEKAAAEKAAKIEADRVKEAKAAAKKATKEKEQATRAAKRAETEEKLAKARELEKRVGEKYAAIGAAEDYVRKALKSPRSAKFLNIQAILDNQEEWIVGGQVDAKNSFGAELRKTWGVVLKYSPSDSSYKLKAIEIEGE